MKKRNPGQCPEQQVHRLRATPITVKGRTQEPRRKQPRRSGRSKKGNYTKERTTARNS